MVKPMFNVRYLKVFGASVKKYTMFCLRKIYLAENKCHVRSPSLQTAVVHHQHELLQFKSFQIINYPNFNTESGHPLLQRTSSNASYGQVTH